MKIQEKTKEGIIMKYSKQLFYRRLYLDLIVDKNYDKGINFGIHFFWLHKHNNDCYLHYHFLIDFIFWFIELRIGRDDEKSYN